MPSRYLRLCVVVLVFCWIAPSKSETGSITDEDMSICHGLLHQDIPDVSYDSSWKELPRGHVPDGLRVWGKLEEGSAATTFVASGTLHNVTSSAVLATFEGTNFTQRKTWDPSCLALNVISSHETDQVVRWVTDLPWPLSDREYIFRRRIVCREDGSCIAVSKTVAEESVLIARDPSLVRVRDFVQYSQIRPSKDGKGVDVGLLYRNDLEGSLPHWVVKWFSNIGLPIYLKQIEKEIRSHSSHVK
ncbi:START domain-containing protein [Guillardia theta CCMP2712]|uniref:START domain-containing protein n=1 Tax=Guillardia theta (strain CCMP2712) TaxID=905079 RepID=L1JIS7_GUITC|nr:START domain-containing protein [Guillardia theta CCMP2712]EKX48391.1 START domain-containing protein [Guillardia theta CCMP2712]|eukprot:XP_005835371.1 START domain-containing protein [Guillardia theta CCMP2712]